MDKLLQDLDKYLDWLETPNENFGGRPVCPFLAPDRKNGKLKIEIYDSKVKTIWEHILVYDREDYNTALFLHIDDSIREVTRAKWQTYLREGMRAIGLNHLKPTILRIIPRVQITHESFNSIRSSKKHSNQQNYTR